MTYKQQKEGNKLSHEAQVQYLCSGFQPCLLVFLPSSNNGAWLSVCQGIKRQPHMQSSQSMESIS